MNELLRWMACLGSFWATLRGINIIMETYR